MLRIGRVQLETPLLLAPIAGHCDLAFRLIVRSIRGPSGGAGLACTDLLCPQAILRETDKTMWLAATCPEDQPLCMQLYGRHPDVMADAARWAEAHGATTIDINMGCPVDKVTKKNGGSKLLTEPCVAVDVARAVVDAVRVPVTAKIRLGWDDKSFITDTLPTAMADVGIAAVTVHGRTTEQMFKGSVRLEGIARVVEAMARRHPDVAVIGNGDVTTPQDAKRMMDVTGCGGVMIGRGALGQPWVFREAAHYLRTGQLLGPLPRAERARIVLRHFETLLRLRGEDRPAVAMIRTRISRYSAALQPWPGLRRDVHHIRDVEQFRDYMAAGIERIEAEDGALTAAA
jgi:nifR3 family TIM-barrel protein